MPDLNLYREPMRPKWEVVNDVHEANYLPAFLSSSSTATTAAARVGTLPARYLPQRDQGENLDAYEYAVRMVEPGGLLAYTVGSLAGQIAAAEAEIARTWAPVDDEGTVEPGSIFGSPDDEGTEANRLWNDADGRGTNWGVLWRMLTGSLILYQEYWLVVDGVRTETLVPETDDTPAVTVTRDPCVRLMAPWTVQKTEETAGILTSVQFRETQQQGAHTVDVFTTYGLSGWRRETRKGDDVQQTQQGDYAYYDDVDRTVPRLPVYRVRLPFETYHAYLWARKELSILNMRMRYDAVLNLGNSPRLARILGEQEQSGPGVNAPESSTGSVTGDEIAAGGRYHEIPYGGDMRYVEPSMTAAAATAAALEAKRQAFAHEAFHLMATEAQQLTATEVRQRSAAGTDAILSVISTSVAEAENQALYLLAQTLAPDRPQQWREASVTRSEDFVAFDAAERTGRMAEAVFGPEAIPVGAKARTEAAIAWCEAHGLAFDREQIAQDVEAWQATRGLLSDAGRQRTREEMFPLGDGQQGTLPDLTL